MAGETSRNRLSAMNIQALHRKLSIYRNNASTEQEAFRKPMKYAMSPFIVDLHTSKKLVFSNKIPVLVWLLSAFEQMHQTVLLFFVKQTLPWSPFQWEPLQWHNIELFRLWSVVIIWDARIGFSKSPCTVLSVVLLVIRTSSPWRISFSTVTNVLR